MADGHRRLSSLLMRGGHKAADALSLGRTWGEGYAGARVYQYSTSDLHDG